MFLSKTLYLWAKHFILCLVLVQPRKTRKHLDMTEKLTNVIQSIKKPMFLRGSSNKEWDFLHSLKICVCNYLNSPYEGCSNMNASSFITFFAYMLRQIVIPFWKELFVAFKTAPNIMKHSLYVSSYRPLYKGHSYILKFFWSKLHCTFWYICGYSGISL